MVGSLIVERSKESIQGVVFRCSGDARQHGKGGIWYTWINGSTKQFPQDVESVFIVMPVGWDDPEIIDRGIVCEWTVNKKNVCNAQWVLSGTREKPTLSPSLHWIGMWHGYLRDGYLHSC